MTDLLERYLSAIERKLPKAQAKDIVAELREVLSAKIEAREAELGHPAKADDVAAILKAYGHPVVAASRYAGFDYLIGPNLYPWFWHVQRIAVGLAIAIAFGIVAVKALGSEEPFRAAMRGFNGAIEAALITFGVVTAMFIAAERTKLDMKWAEKWDPKALPRDHIRQPKSMFETAITLVFDIIFLLWWVKVVQFPAEIPVRDTASVGLAFSPAWAAIYWPVLALMVAVTVVHIADLVHPAWSRLRSVVSIAGHACGMAILWVLFHARPLIEVTPLNGATPEDVDKIFRTVDGILHIALGVMALAWAVAIGIEVWRIWRTARPTTLPAAPHGLSN
jgi:hypothetical protein